MPLDIQNLKRQVFSETGIRLDDTDPLFAFAVIYQMQMDDQQAQLEARIAGIFQLLEQASGRLATDTQLLDQSRIQLQESANQLVRESQQRINYAVEETAKEEKAKISAGIHEMVKAIVQDGFRVSAEDIQSAAENYTKATKKYMEEIQKVRDGAMEEIVKARNKTANLHLQYAAQTAIVALILGIGLAWGIVTWTRFIDPEEIAALRLAAQHNNESSINKAFSLLDKDTQKKIKEALAKVNSESQKRYNAQ